jgi:hypothetical protein
VSIYVTYNGWKDDVVATLPANLPGGKWRRAFDTSAAHEAKNNSFDPPEPVGAGKYKVAARSVLILVEGP